MSTKIINKISAKSDAKLVFQIEKEFSINNIEHVKNELNEIVAENKPFTLKVKNIETFDLSAIQVITSLKKQLNDSFNCHIEIKEEQKEIFVHAGFEQIFNDNK